MAVTMLGEVLSSWLWLTMGLTFLSSISLAFINIIISSYMVSRIDEHVIGRVNGTIMPLFMGTMLIGSSLAGVIMNQTSLIFVYVISVIIMLLSIIPGLRVQFNDQNILNNGELKR